ncbi:MAG: glycosyltransferase [Bacteroidales bacterium]
MKILFLHFFDTSQKSGVNSKIASQIAALRELGHTVELCQIEIDPLGEQRRVCEGEIIESFGRGSWAKFIKWFRFKKVTKYIVENGYQLLYVRSFYNTTPSLLKMFRRVKESGVKVAVELPTYPYNREFDKIPLRNKFTFYIDKLYRGSLYKVIDRVVTFSNFATIFNTPTIRISNGVDFSNIEVKSANTLYNKEWSGTFTMIGVAEIHYWHGFDRIIEGMALYYKNRVGGAEVKFEIVGEGNPNDLAKLKRLVEHHKLNGVVHFHGYLYGSQLDSLFEEAHIAVASLARHRSGIVALKTLKTREYAARGIPFIYSEIDDDFEEKPYILKAPMDNSPISIEGLLSFWRGVELTPQQIRESVEGTLSWRTQMEKVVEAIKNSEEDGTI